MVAADKWHDISIYGRPTVGGTPLIKKPGRGRHQLDLVLRLNASSVEDLGRDPGVTGDREHADEVRGAHPQADGIQHGGVIGRFQGRRLAPLVDRSD